MQCHSPEDSRKLRRHRATAAFYPKSAIRHHRALTHPPLGGRGSRRAVAPSRPALMRNLSFSPQRNRERVGPCYSAASVVQKRVLRLSRSFALPNRRRLIVAFRSAKRAALHRLHHHLRLPPPWAGEAPAEPSRCGRPQSGTPLLTTEKQRTRRGAQLCGLCELCGSKKSPAAQQELRPPRVGGG
jgi:hypothetical protein